MKHGSTRTKCEISDAVFSFVIGYLPAPEDESRTDLQKLNFKYKFRINKVREE